MAYKGAQPFSASPGRHCFLDCICSALAHAEDDLSKLQEGVQVAHHGSSMAAKMCQDVRRFVFFWEPAASQRPSRMHCFKDEFQCAGSWRSASPTPPACSPSTMRGHQWPHWWWYHWGLWPASRASVSAGASSWQWPTPSWYQAWVPLADPCPFRLAPDSPAWFCTSCWPSHPCLEYLCRLDTWMVTRTQEKKGYGQNVIVARCLLISQQATSHTHILSTVFLFLFCLIPIKKGAFLHDHMNNFPSTFGLGGCRWGWCWCWTWRLGRWWRASSPGLWNLALMLPSLVPITR